MGETATTLALFGGIVWLAWASRYSRQAVWLLLLWIPVQGWIQLNVFNDSSATVLLYEVQIIGIYIVFAVRALHSPRRFGPPPIIWFAVPFTIWAFLLVPSSVAANGLVVTLLGMRTYLLPLPLVWIGYRAFENRRQLENVGWALMLQLIVVAAVTVAQFRGVAVSTMGYVVELQTGYSETSSVIRPPGTFSSPGHMGMYLLLAIPLAVGLIGLKVKPWQRTGFMVGLAAAIVALMVNTQRATIVLVAVVLPAAVLLARKLQALRLVPVAVAVLLAGGIVGSQVAGEAFGVRISTISDDVRETLVGAPIARFADALERPVVGGGLGIASPGANRLVAPAGTRNIAPAQTISPAESFMAALVYEAGVPGLVLFYLFMVALVRYGLRVVRECRETDMALLAATILCFELAIWLQSWSYDPLHYPPSRVVFWFWSGVLLSLPRLAARATFPERVAVQRTPAVSAPRRLTRPTVPSAARRPAV